MNIYIYGLINPLKNRFFYIGQTNNLSRRLAEHITDDSNSIKAVEIQELRELGLVPNIIILEVANEQTANAVEQKWIDFMLAANTELTNSAIASYSSSPLVREVRWIDRLSINSTLEEIGSVFLDFSFGIKKIYRLHNLYFIMTEKTCERVIPAFSNGVSLSSFVSALRLESNSRRERELVNFVTKVVNNMKAYIKKSPNILPFNPISFNIEFAVDNVEHLNFIQYEFYTSISANEFVFAFKHHYAYLTYKDFVDKFLLLKSMYDIIPENITVDLDFLYRQS